MKTRSMVCTPQACRIAGGALIVAASMLGLAACGEAPSGEIASESEAGGIQVVALALSSSDVVSVTASIAGPGLTQPMRSSLSKTSGQWSATISGVPVGSDYSVSIVAADANGTAIYQGTATGVVIRKNQTATVLITAQQVKPSQPFGNAAPVLDAVTVSSAHVAPGDTVTLVAQAHDPDTTDTLTYAWSGDGGTFATSSAASTTWTSSVEGDFSVRLSVTDPKGATASASVAIHVHPESGTGRVAIEASFNTEPVVTMVAGDPLWVKAGTASRFTVTASDADGDPLGYVWSSSCAGTFDDPHAASPSFTLDTTAADLQCTLAVEVSDGRGGSTSGTLIVPVGEPKVWITPAPLDLYTVTSLDRLNPGQLTSVKVLAKDGIAHPSWTYVWSDGKAGAAVGSFRDAVTGNGADELYLPATCSALGGNDQSITLTVTVSDSESGQSGVASVPVVVHCPAPTYYTTKTPYAPQELPASYEAPPNGFSPVYTELVARHGSRGLSSFKYDGAAYSMWQKANAEGAVTTLGSSLGSDVLALTQANTTLGAGVSGISKPGYGNLTMVGINEQRQLAARLLQRLPTYFAQVAASAGTGSPRQIVVVSSGVDRAVDSASFFKSSLTAHAPALGSLITLPAAPVGYPANAPVTQPAGTNRFLLYFHKLAASTDQVTTPTDPYYPTYTASLAYQAFLASDAAMNGKVKAILASPEATAASTAILQGLFTQDFINKLGASGYVFANTGSYTFAGADGLNYSVTGDGKTKVQSVVDAASMLYNLYIIAPAMANEAPTVDFARYLPALPTQQLAYLQDAQDFYQMGPSTLESGSTTYAMARALLDDFFNEIDAVVRGDLSHAAKLRFTHAEDITPFTSLLGLKNVYEPVPVANTYTYETNPWRGERVSPMAANIQWDVYTDGAGHVLVKMLHNERETDFKPGCDDARFAPGSHFYDYAKLKACYGHVAN